MHLILCIGELIELQIEIEGNTRFIWNTYFKTIGFWGVSMIKTVQHNAFFDPFWSFYQSYSDGNILIYSSKDLNSTNQYFFKFTWKFNFRTSFFAQFKNPLKRQIAVCRHLVYVGPKGKLCYEVTKNVLSYQLHWKYASFGCCIVGCDFIVPLFITMRLFSLMCSCIFYYLTWFFCLKSVSDSFLDLNNHLSCNSCTMSTATTT